jgi:hypothetical protein
MKISRLSICAILVSLLAAACGQFEGAHGGAAALGGGASGAALGTVAGANRAAVITPTDTSGQAVAAPGAPAAGAPAPGARSRGSGAAQKPGRGDTTGVTASAITVGFHAPLTGAAPLKASSFSAGNSLYWDKGNDGKPIEVYGRRVKVVFQDDQYNPSHARLVCQQMAEGQNAFLLIGGGGTDQIQACAQYAATRGIPYVSVGTTEIGLRSLPNYFPFSMSYAQQAKLVVQYVRNVLKVTDAARVAAVVTNTANFDDFVDALTKAFPGVKLFRNDKSERGSNRASSLCTGTVKNFDVVITPNAPAYYLEMAGAARCKPLYVGPGVTNGLDQVADLGCKSDQSTLNARFFSPSPSFDDALKSKHDPLFRKVAPSDADDIVWLLWGLSKTIHQMLLAAGPNLSRQGFNAAMETARIHTGVFPDLAYAPRDHFGATQVSVLKNVCAARGNASGYYVTEAAFRSSF